MTAQPAASAEAKPDKPAADSAATLTWDKDPLVVISRARWLTFPLALLREPVDDKAIQRWHGPQARAADRNERVLHFFCGPTFLGVMTTSWALRGIAEQQRAPTAPPHPDRLRHILPDTTARDALLGRDFVAKETGKIDPVRVREALERVLGYLRHDKILGDHFRPEPGFDDPQIVVIKVSELFAQQGEFGPSAFAMLGKLIPFCKSSEHLGALHDYAVRAGSHGWPIVNLCRQRAAAFGNAIPRST